MVFGTVLDGERKRKRIAIKSGADIYHTMAAFQFWEPFLGVAILFSEIMQFCRVLVISNIGAKCDFEIWGFKGFLSLDKKNSH